MARTLNMGMVENMKELIAGLEVNVLIEMVTRLNDAIQQCGPLDKADIEKWAERIHEALQGREV